MPPISQIRYEMSRVSRGTQGCSNRICVSSRSDKQCSHPEARGDSAVNLILVVLQAISMTISSEKISNDRRHNSRYTQTWKRNEIKQNNLPHNDLINIYKKDLKKNGKEKEK